MRIKYLHPIINKFINECDKLSSDEKNVLKQRLYNLDDETTGSLACMLTKNYLDMQLNLSEIIEGGFMWNKQAKNNNGTVEYWFQIRNKVR